MKDKLLYTNLLIILQNFENLWNMYSISGGLLYRSETKKSAKIFLEIFNKVADKHPAIRNTKELHINSTDSTEHIDSVNQFLKEWTEGDEKFPIPSTELGISDNEKSRYILQSIFMCLSAYLLCKVQLEYNPILCKSSGESSFHQKETAIKTLTFDDKKTKNKVYTIDGKPASTLQKGVNIIRMKDGKTKKVLVK